MLKIGDFSRLSQISIKALHIYDNIGLLKPADVDKFTGYRYYTLKQLPRAHRIMALKEMGMSLEQIGIMLNSEMNLEELRGMFRLKQAELEQRVRDDQKRLAMVEFHLNMIQSEDNMPELDVIVKEIPSFKALYHRFRPVEHQIPTMAEEINQLIAKGDIKHTGQYMGAVYGEAVNPDNYEFAFVVPVTDEQADDVNLANGETLELTTMPTVIAATLVVEGHGEAKLFGKAVLLERWAYENGYQSCHEQRAIHHKGPMHYVPEADFVTELQVIIEPQ